MFKNNFRSQLKQRIFLSQWDSINGPTNSLIDSHLIIYSEFHHIFFPNGITGYMNLRINNIALPWDINEILHKMKIYRNFSSLIYFI